MAGDQKIQERKTSIEERKVANEEKRLMWEQKQKIMFCDLNTLDPDVKSYVIAMRSQLLSQRVAIFSTGLDGTSGGSSFARSGGPGGEEDI
ncbi:hypothetical protein GUJ93_ZPchr0337g7090 [Zizania palustris]|uniref:No apical meristem-associated C-terminal domain-containing protein n=1 Tax=Zizania palustris TaxID=103762 RepID=A0A8J5R8P3_ZIZPA|nr:hypothetical protein GUJ93_ZPchr0337g7090 [Zizania palustris]